MLSLAKPVGERHSDWLLVKLASKYFVYGLYIGETDCRSFLNDKYRLQTPADMCDLLSCRLQMQNVHTSWLALGCCLCVVSSAAFDPVKGENVAWLCLCLGKFIV